MKTIISILLLLLFLSCSEPSMEYIGQDVIYGRISAKENGRTGRMPILPRIWVQSNKITKEVSIPFKYENKWEIGDSCLLIIQKYKVNENNQNTK